MVQYVQYLSEMCRLVVENSIIGCAQKCKYMKKLCSRMCQMRDYPAWYLCQNHSKMTQNVTKSQKMVRNPRQI